MRQNRLFCVHCIMEGVMGTFRSAVPQCGDASPVAPATMLSSIKWWQFSNQTEATIMSNLTSDFARIAGEQFIKNTSQQASIFLDTISIAILL